ncbi:MAG TPA: hypothetical protein VFH06_05835 [Candidatus Saccharimonadales bacterium]|nr:hypothetical protein [Candidatus Saccharimonadales bacterium]
MATGLNIRDFQKRYREVQYSEQGSIRLSEVEHNAYLNRLTLEITNYDASRSVNYKTLPENTHWGYLTTFKGSSVIASLGVKFVKQRVFEHINNSIWEYHNAQENIWLLSSIVQKYGQLALGELSSLDEGIGIPGLIVNAVEGVENLTAPAIEWLVEQFTGGELTPDNPAQAYSAFPVASPFPDVFKFKADIPCSFLFRLESWYLVNPVVYTVSNPTDTSDETENESEYPTPAAGDGDGGGQEFPASSAPDPSSDPRDFAEDVDLPGTGVWTFTVSFSDPGNNPFCNNVPASFAQLRGFPDEPPQREFTGPAVPEGGRPGRFFTSVDSFTHGGTCQVNGPGSLSFIPDGPSS